MVLVFPHLHEDLHEAISSSSTILPEVVNLLGDVDGTGRLALAKTS